MASRLLTAHGWGRAALNKAEPGAGRAAGLEDPARRERSWISWHPHPADGALAPSPRLPALASPGATPPLAHLRAARSSSGRRRTRPTFSSAASPSPGSGSGGRGKRGCRRRAPAPFRRGCGARRGARPPSAEVGWRSARSSGLTKLGPCEQPSGAGAEGAGKGQLSPAREGGGFADQRCGFGPGYESLPSACPRFPEAFPSEGIAAAFGLAVCAPETPELREWSGLTCAGTGGGGVSGWERAERWESEWWRGRYRHTSFRCAVIYCASQILRGCVCFFLQLGGFWQPCEERVYRRHFPQKHLLALCLCLILITQNISNFVVIIVFVMVISELPCYHCNCFGALRTMPT